MIAIFTLTLLVSSSLLFLVQPMFARMALPMLGGSPGVWNTCMVFFQAVLLLGYLYAHLSTKWLGTRRQATVHAVLMLTPLLVLPISIGAGWSPPAENDPALWLLVMMSAALGLPFFVVSASAPLMQQWFASLGHARSHDPYFLYAASNAGSMTALLAYPFLLEPLLSLPQQSRLWMYGYVALGLLTITCALAVLRRAQSASPEKAAEHASSDVSWLRWLALAAVPSSLLLGVTSYITADLAVTPLLWVIPLALYLLTFIVVFARVQLVSQATVRRLVPPAAIVLLLLLLIEATEPLVLVIAGHIGAFFVLALACHGELAEDRPAARDLTGFYLMMGLGGVLGGAFNALLAPNLFTSVAEYPIAIAGAALLMVRVADVRSSNAVRWADVVLPLILGAVTVSMIVLSDFSSLSTTPWRLALTAGVPALGCYLLSKRPLQFGLALGAVFAAGTFDAAHHGNIVVRERGFFGVHRVTQGDGRHRLFHGTTLHGAQFIDEHTGEPTRPREPLLYYHREGPAGEVFERLAAADSSPRIAVIGLGVGALAAYAEPEQEIAFYEIDPHVKRIAEDGALFSYLDDAQQRGAEVPVHLGDGRLLIERVEPGRYDMLVLDAFSSAAVPVHLLTQEAMESYWRALDDTGVIMMHISNRYFDLESVLANLAEAGGYTCRIHSDDVTPGQTQRTGRENSVWAIFSRDEQHIQPLLARDDWTIARGDDAPAWTDDYANVFDALRWVW